MFQRADAVESCYEALVGVLTSKNHLGLLASANRSLNRDILELTDGIARVFQSLEAINKPTLNLVAPSNYLLMKSFAPVVRETAVMKTFKTNL